MLSFSGYKLSTATEDEQIGIFERYCKFLNSLDCNFKITINNKNKDMVDLRELVLLSYCNDEYDGLRKISRLRKNIKQMEDDKITNKLKNVLNDAVDRMEKRCKEIKEHLNRVCEFIGLKEKLMGIRDKVKGNIYEGI